LPSAYPDRVAEELVGILGGDAAEVVRLSAKTGLGVDELLERLVAEVPPPAGDPDAPLRAVVFDSYFDAYRGVVCYVRVVDGRLDAGDRLHFMATGEEYGVNEVGVLTPKVVPLGGLGTGEVGYLITGVKEIDRIKVGDTVTSASRPATVALPGYEEP